MSRKSQLKGVLENVLKMIEAPSCYAGLKEKAKVWIDSVHTKDEATAAKDLLEEIEAGVGADVMVHTVAPVLRQTRLHELLLFRMNGVLKITRILQGDFLIPALLAYSIFTLEGVETRYADVQLRQCQVNSGVAHVLIGAHGKVQRHAKTRESCTESYVRSTGRL